MSSYSKKFLEKTIRVWQQYTPKHLSSRDAQEIVENMTGLFSLLSEWNTKYGKKEGISVRHHPSVAKTQRTPRPS